MKKTFLTSPPKTCDPGVGLLSELTRIGVNMDSYEAEERICIIQESCGITRAEAEREAALQAVESSQSVLIVIAPVKLTPAPIKHSWTE